MISNIFILLTSINLCLSYTNTSSVFEKLNVINKSTLESRQSKLISFQTHDESIEVELGFAVPFLSIPVKKSLSLTQGSIANVNIGALALSGGLVVGVTLILPIVLGFFSKLMHHNHPTWNYAKQSEKHSKNGDPASEFWEVTSFFNDILRMNNIDPTSCMQKIVCSTIVQSLGNVRDGKPTSSDKIVDGIVSNVWLNEQLYGTPMYFALQNGVNGKNCTEIYSKCTMTLDAMETIVDIFQQFIMKYNKH